MKRLVAVADNPLIVAAIRGGIRSSPTLELIGYVHPARASAAQILDVRADAALVDETDDSEVTLGLIRALREASGRIRVILLAFSVDDDWVCRALTAGASAAIAKSVHPSALATLIRETIAGHIFHAPALVRPPAASCGQADGDHASLTDREREILRLVSSGATNGLIARELWITQQTVKFHVSNIYRKLGVANRTEACHYAHLNGIAAGQDGEAAPAPTVLAGAS
jgi:DNA-binding NarL/FixJ family response regulator